MKTPELLTLAEASVYLNVPRATLAYWVYRLRWLPHVSLGPGGRTGRRACRIRKSVLDELIARGERPVFRLHAGGKS